MPPKGSANLGMPVGIRQRLGIAKASAKPKAKASDLGLHLAKQFAVGRMRASDVGDASAAASSSSNASADVLRLAQGARKDADTNDKPSKNSARSVKRTLAQMAESSGDNFKLTPYFAEVPMWDEDRQSQVFEPVAFLPPHEALHAAVPVGEEDGWCSISSSQEGLRGQLDAWARRTRTNVAVGPPIMSLPLWGDAAPMHHRNSLNLLTFKVLAGERRRRFWIVALPKRGVCRCGCGGRCSFQAVWQVTSYFFQCLLTGRWPEVDHLHNKFPTGSMRAKYAGRPMRFRAGCVSKVGDWAWYKQALNLQGWQSRVPTARVCWLCRATIGDLDKCGLDAPWRGTEVNTADVLAGGCFVSTIWSIPGLVLSSVKPDWMHVCCLGVLQYLQGDVLWELVLQLGGTITNHRGATTKLMGMIKAMSHEIGVKPPFHSLTIGMIRAGAGKPPKLKLKAAEGRHLLPVLRAVLTNCFDMSSEHAILRYHCVDALNSCYEEFKDWKGNGESSRRLGQFARRHVVLRCELRSQAESERVWCMFPKHHIFIHAAENSRVNPVVEWCYGDESEIGDAVKVASSMHPLHVHRELIERYCITNPFL